MSVPDRARAASLLRLLSSVRCRLAPPHDPDQADGSAAGAEAETATAGTESEADPEAEASDPVRPCWSRYTGDEYRLTDAEQEQLQLDRDGEQDQQDLDRERRRAP